MLDIVFISDYVCPYCLVAKEALKRALQETGTEAVFRFQPYELSPDGRPQVDTYHDPVRREHYQVLRTPCAEMGIAMQLPPNIVPRPRTRLAFEGWFYAQERGFGDAWNDRMYTAYFIDGLDIGSIPVLSAIADALGMDGTDLASALTEGRYTAREVAAVAHTKQTWTFRGVPSVFINGEKLEFSTYTVSESISLLQGILPSTPSAPHCSEDGCSFM